MVMDGVLSTCQVALGVDSENRENQITLVTEPQGRPVFVNRCLNSERDGEVCVDLYIRPLLFFHGSSNEPKMIGDTGCRILLLVGCCIVPVPVAVGVIGHACASVCGSHDTLLCLMIRCLIVYDSKRLL